MGNGERSDPFNPTRIALLLRAHRRLHLTHSRSYSHSGIDEAAAIAKVVQLLKREQFSDFSRIVFDTVGIMCCSGGVTGRG